MAMDASFQAGGVSVSEPSQPACLAEGDGRGLRTPEPCAVDDADAPLSEAERKAIAEKIWAWEQRQFPVKGPRLRLPARGIRPDLSIPQILEWADAHYRTTGLWPTEKSGTVRDSPYGDTWGGIDSALNRGRRGLPRGSSLRRLLAEERDVRPPLRIRQILAWADAHFADRGEWPTKTSGVVTVSSLETWSSLDHQLRDGGRGLPGGTTLAQVLAENRGRKVRNPYTIPQLSPEQIVAWADAHHAATGRWPSVSSGEVVGALPGETWCAINAALIEGRRGLKGRTTLSQLLVAHRGSAALNRRPDLTVDQILAWVDAHHAAHGRWPVEDSGAVMAAPRETWGAISQALLYGRRGLSAGSSLARLLQDHRGVRNPRALPTLTLVQILAWADAYRTRHGDWPTARSGPVAEAPGEEWVNLDLALRKGFRGLPRGTTLAKLLTERRPDQRRRLTLAKVRAWADAHRRLTGRWPDACAGPVLGAPHEEWNAINLALRDGRRGLPAGLSLRKLFGRTRDPAAQGARPELSVEQVLAWADAHHAAHGSWPSRTSGPVAGAAGEKWVNIDMALRHGRRGLPSQTSLARLLGLHRGARSPAAPLAPALSSSH
jgi:hypothetical protein